MSFEVYNLKNQKLSAEELITILQYSTKHFAGSIGDESPLTITGNNATFEDGNLIIDGMYFKLNQSRTVSIESEGTLFAIIVDIDGIKAAANISTNDYNNLNNLSDLVKLELVSGFNNKNIKVTTSIDEDNVKVVSIKDNNGEGIGWDDFRYNAKIFTSYYVGNSQSSGKNYYIIPIAAYFEGKVQSLFKHFSLDDYEQFLTLWAVEKFKQDIKQELNGLFVLRAGSTDADPAGGHIGNINITGDKITKHAQTTKPIYFNHAVQLNGEISGTGLANYKKNTLDVDYVLHEKGGRIADLNITKNVISTRSGSGNDRIDIASKYVRFTGIAGRLDIKEGQAYPVWMESNGNISAKYRNLPISMGGTGAATWMDARSNFHIHVYRHEGTMAAAIVRMKEKYRNEPAGTICFLVAHANNKHDLAVCLKRSAADSTTEAWDIIQQ